MAFPKQKIHRHVSWKSLCWIQKNKNITIQGWYLMILWYGQRSSWFKWTAHLLDALDDFGSFWRLWHGLRLAICPAHLLLNQLISRFSQSLLKLQKKHLVVYSDLWDWMKRIESIERNRLTWCKYVQIRESTTWITKQFSCIQDGLQSSWLVGGTNASSLQLCMSLWGSHVKMFDITYKREWLQVQFENM